MTNNSPLPRDNNITTTHNRPEIWTITRSAVAFVSHFITIPLNYPDYCYTRSYKTLWHPPSTIHPVTIAVQMIRLSFTRLKFFVFLPPEEEPLIVSLNFPSFPSLSIITIYNPQRDCTRSDCLPLYLPSDILIIIITKAHKYAQHDKPIGWQFQFKSRPSAQQLTNSALRYQFHFNCDSLDIESCSSSHSIPS